VSDLHLVLVHHPVLDRAGATVTTAITNLDLHDMARSGRTYGARHLWIVHPITAQRALAERIQAHWVEGSGGKRIPDRSTALAILRIVPTLEDVWRGIADDAGRAGLEMWTTAASAKHGELTSWQGARSRLDAASLPVALLFGTGWGLASDVIRAADVRIAPIDGAPGSGFNHLSVRAACAIALDRLRG
jgi:hypothetical protein